jgi:ketosteroid isomerase-like protein
MSIEENRSLVSRYFAESVNRINGPDRAAALGVVDELMSPDFVMVYNSDDLSRGMHGPKRHKAFLIEHARSYPDDAWTVEALVADEETVACVWRIEARHAASGNRIDVRAGDFFRVRDGQLVELRRFLDFDDLHRQTQPTIGT